MNDQQIANALVSTMNCAVATMQERGVSVSNREVYAACLTLLAMGIGAERDGGLRATLHAEISANLLMLIEAAAGAYGAEGSVQ